MSRRDDLEAVRASLRATDDLDAAIAGIGEQGAYVLRRFAVAQAADTSDLEHLGASWALLGVEVSARLGIMAKAGKLDSEDADRLIAGVGGAFDAADTALDDGDVEGARRFTEAAMDVLGV